jgi:hypothetical protein
MAITYPVDSASRWSIYSISQSAIILRDQSWPRGDRGAVVGLDADLVYLLQVEDAQPSYDALCYTIERAETVDTEANTVTRGWAVVDRPLPDAQVAKLAAIRAEAQSRIYAKWPQWLQANIALGLDPDLAEDCTDDIAAVRSASNSAEAAIEASTTLAELEAVSASWPTL